MPETEHQFLPRDTGFLGASSISNELQIYVQSFTKLIFLLDKGKGQSETE